MAESRALKPRLPILIVGAGLAGLTIAHRLQQAGVRAEVVESCDRVGGRIQSLPDAFHTGLTAELGGEAFDSDHVACLSLIRELGLTCRDLHEQIPLGPLPTYFFKNRRILPAELAESFSPIAARLRADQPAVRRFWQTGQLNPTAEALDRLSICEYLDLIETSDLVKAVIRVAYTLKYGCEAAAQSSLNFIHFCNARTGQFNLFGHSDERFRIAGGNGQLVQQLAEDLEIETGTALESLRQVGRDRFRASFQQGSQTRERDYALVVMTIPFSVLRRLDLQVTLPPRQRRAIDTLGYNSSTKLITAYQERIWHTRHGSDGVTLTDLPMQSCWETGGTSGQTGGPPGPGLLTNYTGGQQGQQTATAELTGLTHQLLSDLEQVHPGLAAHHIANAALRTQWGQQPYSRGAYSCYLVGQWSRLYGTEGQRAGNLFFAGEHCSRGYQGYMEGACETAEAVALPLFEQLGLSRAARLQRSRLQRYQAERTAVWSGSIDSGTG